MKWSAGRSTAGYPATGIGKDRDFCSWCCLKKAYLGWNLAGKSLMRQVILSGGSDQSALQRQVPGRHWAEARFQVFEQQAATCVRLLFQAQRIDAGGFRAGQAVFAKQGQEFAADQVFTRQPGGQVRDTQAGQGTGEQGFGVVGAHADALRAIGGATPVQFEAPGEDRRQAIPVQAVVFAEVSRMGRRATVFQVGRAGTGNTHDAGQRRGDQPGVDDMPGTQHQIDLTQVRALHVHEAVDQMQVHIQPRVDVQEVGDHRRQMPSTERRRRVHANQAFRRMAQGHRFRPCQLQLGDDAAARARRTPGRPGVGSTAWVLRWNKRLPTELSRLSIRRATAEGVSGWRRAAAEKLPVSSTSRNRLSWSVRICGFIGRRLCGIGTAIVRCCAYPRQNGLRSMQGLGLWSNAWCWI